MPCVIFRVVLWRMGFNSRHFGTLCVFHLHRRVDAKCMRVENCDVADRYRLVLTLAGGWIGGCLWQVAVNAGGG
jgi:hypothetical protein